MRLTTSFLVSICAIVFGCKSLIAQSTDLPNIVLIISDDQAWTDYGFMGHPTIETPNLDRLAERSLVFERGYVASPLCRPSLGSIVTGLFPFEHGVTGNDVDGRNNRAELDVPLRETFHQHPSLIRLLTDNGYVAHQSGKWWEGSSGDGGFTHGMTHGDPERGGRHGDDGLRIGRNGMKPVTDFIDDAVAADQPFFVWYAPFLPHTPHNPPQTLLEKYTDDGRSPDVAAYYAMCEWFDQTCGELIDHLETREVVDDTLVLYICDNGWAATSTNRDDPAQQTWQGFALRSKGSPFENGIRTPVLVSWPGQIEPARVDQLAHAIDFYPTIAAAANLPSPSNLTGVNLLDEDSRAQRERVFGVVHSIHNMTLGNPDQTQKYLWCVENEWKLIVRYDGLDTTRYRNVHAWDTTPVRLYNLKQDPHESVNLADGNPRVVERLMAEIENWRSSIEANAQD